MNFATLKNKKILITGHTGFKGSWLSMMLLKQGAILYGISRAIPGGPSLFGLSGLVNDIHHIIADISGPSILDEIGSIRPDIIFHLAAQAITREGISEPRYTIENNLSATMSILEYLRTSETACTAIFVTSDKCYYNQEWPWGYRETDMLGGKEPYGASKAVCEIVYASYHHTYFQDMKHITSGTVRSGNVIGGGDFGADRIIPDCIKAWQKDEPVSIRNKGSIRPWMHVMEPLRGYIMLCCDLMDGKKCNGESFNFGPSDNIYHTVADVVDSLGSHLYSHKPDLLYTESNAAQSKEAKTLRLCSDKAEHYLVWKPKLSFQESVKLTAEWYDTFLQDPSNIRTLMNTQIENYIGN